MIIISVMHCYVRNYPKHRGWKQPPPFVFLGSEVEWAWNWMVLVQGVSCSCSPSGWDWSHLKGFLTHRLGRKCWSKDFSWGWTSACGLSMWSALKNRVYWELVRYPNKSSGAKKEVIALLLTGWPQISQKSGPCLSPLSSNDSIICYSYLQ